MRSWQRVTGELVLVGLAIAAAFAPVRPSTVESWFSAWLYPSLQPAVTSLSNRIPFALLDLLTIGGTTLVAWRGAVALGRSRRNRAFGPVARFLRGLGATAGLIYLAFLVLWGFNYRRLPMTERVVRAPDAPTAESVTRLGFEATDSLNALYETAHQTGWAESPIDNVALRQAFASTERALGTPRATTLGRLKPTLFGFYFRWTGVDGMINPLGLEVLANPDLLPFERPFVAAHEWSHLAGYADEAEANFVGWITCVRGDVPAQYSGWLFLYWQVRSEVDPPTRERLFQALAAGPRRDLDAIATRVTKGELPWLRLAGWQVYDQYLKANRVEAGVRSYGAVVTLILQTEFEPGWVPMLRRGPGS